MIVFAGGKAAGGEGTYHAQLGRIYPILFLSFIARVLFNYFNIL